MIGIGSTLNQRFTLDSELGRGGMGAVYRATDQVLGRNVAIKVLKDSGSEEVGKRIRLEAQILARLLHDNVVRLYDFGESEGDYFLVMEEVDGTSFSKRWRHLPMAERLRIASQVAEALDYAHHQGVIHRDVKPANVLLTAASQAKLSDFGLSMMAGDREETGTVRGTPHYMSPEQASGKRLDHRSDLYSLGVLLYECVTGSTPFQGTGMAVLAQHISETVTPPRFKCPAISPDLETLILSLLAKAPEQRPPSGDAVASILRVEAEKERARGGQAEDHDPSTTVAIEPSPSGTRGIVDTPSSVAPTDRATPSAPPIAPMPRQVAVIGVESPLAREMLEAVLKDPLVLDPDERYLCGHYLAYLLGGARRRGLFLRRPLDPRNADRARLMLAMTWLMLGDPTEEMIARAAELLDSDTDARPALNPVVVMKYLASRDSAAKRKRFRKVRLKLQDASAHAQRAMLDQNGVLNPGLMPQSLDDLRKIAPVRDVIDDQLVGRWNRVAEVWRDHADFRGAVLRYATRSAHRQLASAYLWPEVVYPLIERARWQRSFRPRHEAVWDYLSANVLRRADAGVRLDRLVMQAIPSLVAERLDEDLAAFVEDPRLDDDMPKRRAQGERLIGGIGQGISLHELAADEERNRGLVILVPPDPYRVTQGELRELWRGAMAAIGKPGAKARSIAVGPYRVTVIPSIRGGSAGQVAIQGMPNKQIELLTPSIRAGGGSGKPVIAVWVYQDASALIAHLDFKGLEKYILWHAPNAQQFNYEVAAELNHMLLNLNMEAPDQLDRVLTKKFRPRNTA